MEDDSPLTKDAGLPPPPKPSATLTSSSSFGQLLSMDNPIQLAAISNYKLAQLTFAPPDFHSLRKTAIIKNMLDILYRDTPVEWLESMTRWEFFTPESLGDKTQEDLEIIFAQYVQTIEAFQPIRLRDSDDDDEQDQEDDDEVWSDCIEHTDQSSLADSSSSFYSHPHASISGESLALIQAGAATQINHRTSAMAALPDGSPSEEASKLEQRRKSRSLTEEVTRSTTQQSHRRKSVTMTGSGGDEVVSRRRSSLIEDIGLPQGRRKSLAQRNRLSWTSDTGVTSSAVAEHLASEMMSLFDMEFSIDIQLSTAPKLPELTFSKRRSQRVSVDSLAALIPRFENYDMSGDAFESIVQNPKARPRKMTFPPPPAAPPPNPVNRSRSVSVPGDPDHIVSPPTRSSSLKQRRKFDPAAKYTDRNESCPPPLPKDKHINDNVPALKKKTSLRRLASFVSNASRKAMSRPAVPPINLQDKPLPEYPPKLDLQTLSPDAAANPSFEPPKPQRSLEELMTKAPSRQSLTSSVSSAWSSVSEFKVATKATNPYEQQPLVVLDIPPMVSNVSIGASENPKRRSYMLIRPTVIDAQDLRRSRSTGHRPSRRKRRSLMETTQSRRKSRQRKSMQEHLQQLELATAPPTIEPPRRKDSLRRHAVQAQAQNGDTTTSTPSQPSSAALSRSKSAFIRIGSLRSKHRKKKTEEPDLRRAVTLSKSETNVQKGNVNYAVHHSGYSESSLSSSDSNHTHERFHSSQSNFVRRLTTFGRRKKHDPASPHPM